MGSLTRFAAAVGFAGAAAALCAFPAEAGCKRMAFSVNDYGKEGPTKDSQDLLDKHIATWAAEQGIEKFTVGKKDVSCELFLNLIVVDEHTCTARATVCWGGDKLPSAQEAKSKGAEKTAAKADAAPDAASPDAAAKAKDAAKSAKAPDAKAPDTKAADTKSTDAKAADTKPADTKAADAKPDAASTPAPVETGALPHASKSAETTAKAADAPHEKPADKPAADTFSVSDRDAVAAAAAAAERAAAAAERAAAAAERAAAAATEQAAIIAKAQSASSAAPAPEPPAFGAASQPVVAPIQPEHPKQ
jgi:hypothetical protein